LERDKERKKRDNGGNKEDVIKWKALHLFVLFARTGQSQKGRGENSVLKATESH
jgi:hypothetical protein